MKKNSVLIYVICAIVTVALIGAVIFMIVNNNKKNEQVHEVYGVIKSVNSDSILLTESTNNQEKTYIIDDNSGYHKGDLVVVKVKGSKVQSYQVIIEDYNSITSIPVTTTTTTTTTTIVIPDTTTTSTGYTPKTTTSTTTTKVVMSADDTVLGFVKNEYETIKSGDNTESFKDKAKQAFITTVDFIFYDGEIKGVKFKDLTAKGKAKVIYYALLIDAGIDSKFPGYKDKIASKYNDIKGKLVAEYLELKYDICSNHKDGCDQVKEDLNFLKNTLSLTWDAIKSFFGYVKDLSVPKIKDWYESFRG